MSPMMTLGKALTWLGDATLAGDADVAIGRVHTDTRTIEPGDLFVALKGEKFDANDFLHDAQKAGAVAVLCHRDLPQTSLPQGLHRIEVSETRVALGQLAKGWRSQFPIPVIAVTGSNGKTTVTQMLASILQAYAPGTQSHATRGNLNNDIGVPLTLLQLHRDHQIAVVEMGMNHPGEIAVLADMVQPTVALVNNAQREHLEFMHTVEAVARENGAVIQSLPSDGVAVFPADDDFSALWQQLCDGRTAACFSLEGRPGVQHLVCSSAHWADGAWQVHATGLSEDFRFALHIAGRHNVKNALAAATCALRAGVPVASVVQGLESFIPVKGRSRAVGLQFGGQALTLVDDTYNANPDSVRAAIDVLSELPSPRLLVLGDMGEVGQNGPAFHAEAGRYAQQKGIEHMVAMGELARDAVACFEGAQHFDSVLALNAAVLEKLPQTRSLLVKGSRFMRMERVVEAVTAHAAKPQEGAPAMRPQGS